jgi:hypothetical protein
MGGGQWDYAHDEWIHTIMDMEYDTRARNCGVLIDLGNQFFRMMRKRLTN